MISHDILIFVTHKLFITFSNFLLYSRSTCLNAIKFTQIASGRSQVNGIPWVSTQLFSLKFIGIMPLISCECALTQLRHRPPNWTLLIKVIFKFTLALKQWLVCTISSATIHLHLRIHSSKNYLLISLHVSTLISSITLPTNTLQMMNQSFQSTLQFLHFIPTIQLIFLNCFFIFLVFYATPSFLPPPPGTKHTKVPPAENDRRPRRRAQKPYKSRRPPDAASSYSCSRLSLTVQAGNSWRHCRRLKLVNNL